MLVLGGFARLFSKLTPQDDNLATFQLTLLNLFQWLVYWTVFAAFSMFDFFAEAICRYFPVYWLLKALFLVYLSSPQTKGASRLYERVVDPAVTKIDALIQKYAKKNE